MKLKKEKMAEEAMKTDKEAEATVKGTEEDPKEQSKASITKEEERIDFGEALNKELRSPIFSTEGIDFESRPTSVFERVLKASEVPFDLYQVSEKWIKIRSAKTKKTWLIERDSFVKKAAAAVLKLNNSKIAAEASEAILPQVKKAAKKDEILEAIKPVVLPVDGLTTKEELEAKIQDYVWDSLAQTKWGSQLEYKVADTGATLDFIATMIAPRSLVTTGATQELKMLDPESLDVAEAKVARMPMSFESSGDVDDETGGTIWRRAVDPILWFGKEVTKKPAKISDYDEPSFALVQPTSSMRQASLKEDEEFGYAK